MLCSGYYTWKLRVPVEVPRTLNRMYYIIMEPLLPVKVTFRSLAGVPVIVSKVHRFLTKHNLNQYNRGRKQKSRRAGAMTRTV
jgi:hypothetical protein